MSAIPNYLSAVCSDGSGYYELEAGGLYQTVPEASACPSGWGDNIYDEVIKPISGACDPAKGNCVDAGVCLSIYDTSH